MQILENELNLKGRAHPVLSQFKLRLKSPSDPVLSQNRLKLFYCLICCNSLVLASPGAKKNNFPLFPNESSLFFNINHGANRENIPGVKVSPKTPLDLCLNIQPFAI